MMAKGTGATSSRGTGGALDCFARPYGCGKNGAFPQSVRVSQAWHEMSHQCRRHASGCCLASRQQQLKQLEQ